MLLAIGGSGGGVQESEGGPGHSSDFSPTRKADRGAHLCLLFGLLRPNHLAPSVAGQGAGTDGAAGIGEVRADANDGRAFPYDRRSRVGFSALHPAGKGPTDAAFANELGTATAIGAKDHGQRRDGKWLQTFAKRCLISKHLRLQLPLSSESRVKGSDSFPLCVAEGYEPWITSSRIRILCDMSIRPDL